MAVNHTVGRREHLLLTQQLQITAWHLTASPISKGVYIEELDNKLEQLGHSHIFSFVFSYKGDNLESRDEIATTKSHRKIQQISSARQHRPTLGYFFPKCFTNFYKNTFLIDGYKSYPRVQLHTILPNRVLKFWNLQTSLLLSLSCCLSDLSTKPC